MTVLNKYRIRCTTESAYRYWWLPEDDSAPTTCPTDTTHEIDPTQTSIVETAGQAQAMTSTGAGYVTEIPSSVGLELCDRDFKIDTCILDGLASLSIAGSTNGGVTYVASDRGSMGNSIRVCHEIGNVGVGHESRDLAVAVSGFDITVTFGTDGGGNSVTPTAAEVAALVNADYTVLERVYAIQEGDGSGAAGTSAMANLTGGLTSSVEDLYVDCDTNQEADWHELQSRGVFKADGSLCSDQSDADINGVVSVWDYKARNLLSMPSLVMYEIKDGYVIVDPSLPSNERWDHRAYAIGAPAIPYAYGGQIKIFDGYLGSAPGGVVTASSPEAKTLDPSLGYGASTLRLYIFHPAGSKLHHVLRLVTYRVPLS